MREFSRLLSNDWCFFFLFFGSEGRRSSLNPQCFRTLDWKADAFIRVHCIKSGIVGMEGMSDKFKQTLVSRELIMKLHVVQNPSMEQSLFGLENKFPVGTRPQMLHLKVTSQSINNSFEVQKVSTPFFKRLFSAIGECRIVQKPFVLYLCVKNGNKQLLSKR